jgi:hypothetical protein
MPLLTLRWKLSTYALVPQSVVPEHHPALLELLWRHPASIVLDSEFLSVLRGYSDPNLTCASVPSIGHKLRQRQVRPIGYRAETPKEVVILEECALKLVCLLRLAHVGILTSKVLSAPISS